MAPNMGSETLPRPPPKRKKSRTTLMPTSIQKLGAIRISYGWIRKPTWPPKGLQLGAGGGGPSTQ
eukprot:11272274-Karenia_brevis.AAC.1